MENHVARAQAKQAEPRSSTASHTPGPWFAMGAGVYSEDPRKFKPGTPLNVVACTGDDGDERAGRQQEADARLIASAPEMLAALKSILKHTYAVQHGQEVRLDNIFAMANAAITRATGEAR